MSIYILKIVERKQLMWMTWRAVKKSQKHHPLLRYRLFSEYNSSFSFLFSIILQVGFSVYEIPCFWFISLQFSWIHRKWLLVSRSIVLQVNRIMLSVVQWVSFFTLPWLSCFLICQCVLVERGRFGSLIHVMLCLIL